MRVKFVKLFALLSLNFKVPPLTFAEIKYETELVVFGVSSKAIEFVHHDD